MYIVPLQAKSAFQNHDYEAGHRYARKARWLATASIITGIIVIIIALGALLVEIVHGVCTVCPLDFRFETGSSKIKF